MDDRDLLDEHALARARLRGGLIHGARWREQPVPGTVRRLAVGLLFAVLACAGLVAASFVSGQLHAGHGLHPASAVAGPAPGQRTSVQAQE